MTLPIIAYCSWSAPSKWGSAMPNQKGFQHVDMVVGPPFYSTAANPDWLPGQPSYSGNSSYLKYFIQAAKVNGGLAMPYLTVQWSIFSQIIANSLSAFVTNTVNLLNTNWGTSSNPLYYDGVILDPEGSQDATAMAKVVQALANALHPMGKYVGITMHYGQQNSWGQDISVSAFNQYCDFGMPMAYDLGGYPNSNRPDLTNTISCLQKVLNAGYTPSKIIGLIPFYGQLDAYQGASATYLEASNKGISLNPDADYFYGSFPYNSTTVTGDWYYGAPGPKVEWSIESGIGGLGMFTLEYDVDYDDSRSLLAAMVRALGGGSTTYNLTIAVSGSGTTNPSAGIYTVNPGQSVLITATPASGYHFVQWSNGNTSPSITITINSNTSITAIFEKDSSGNTYNMNVIITGAGSVTLTDRTLNVTIGTLSASGVIGYNYANQTKPTATPAAGYTFSHWLLDGTKYTTLNSFTFGNRTLEAVFTGGSGGFVSGSTHTAAINLTIAPSGLNCQIELWLSPNQTTKSATSGLVAFTSTGQSQSVSCSVKMPAAGTYNVYLDLYQNGVLLAGYSAGTITVV